MRKDTNNSLIVVLDNIRSAHNVGAAFRCSDAFGVAELWLCGITARPPHAGIDKTALGATESVRWQYAASALEVLSAWPSASVERIAVETGAAARPLHALPPPAGRTRVFVFGHEVWGIQPDVLAACEQQLVIPQQGAKNSLNVSVAIGVVLWHARHLCLPPAGASCSDK